MALTDVQLCNRALTLLGENTITALSDDTEVAAACNLTYEPHTDYLLSIYPWSFAKAQAQLSKDASDPTVEWDYRYVLPPDMLTGPFAIYTTTQPGARPFTGWERQGDYIMSNWDGLWIKYAARPAEANWPVYFYEFVVYSLAAELAQSITGRDSLAEQMRAIAWGTDQRMVGGRFKEARVADYRQNPPARIMQRGNPLITVRGGG